MAKFTKEEFINGLKEMTILEVKELVDAMKEEFGVDPSAVAVAAAPAAGAAAEDNAAKTVVLKDAGATKMQVIKLLKEITGLGLVEAKALADNGGNIKCIAAGKYTLTITDVGSYEYGDKSTDIVFATNSVRLAEGAEPNTATHYVQNTEPMNQGDTITLKATGDQALYTDEGTSYTFSGTASYPAGKVPVTNLNNAYPDAQIPAGIVTIADKTVAFIGYRYGFAGGTNAATIDSQVVRGMDAKKKATTEMDAQDKALEFTAHNGDTKIFFAYPASWTGTPHFEIYGLAWSTINDFVAKTDITVADARGGNEGTTAYKLYVWEPKGGALTADETQFRVWFK